MVTGRPRIEGYAIISSEGMIAASDGSFPENLKIPADSKFYQDSMARASVIAKLASAGVAQAGPGNALAADRPDVGKLAIYQRRASVLPSRCLA